MPSDGTKYGTGDAEVDSRGVPVVRRQTPDLAGVTPSQLTLLDVLVKEEEA